MGRGATEAVVVPAKFSPSCYACIRSLSKRGIRTIVPSGYDDVPAFSSRFCDEAISVPSPHDDLIEYRDALLDIVSRPDAGTIIPIFEEDAYLFSKYRSQFTEHVRVLAPPIETLRKAHDRLRLYDAAREADVPVPETKKIHDVETWDEAQFVKSRYNLLTDEYISTHSSREADLITDNAYLEPGEQPDSTELCRKMKHAPIVQEYVPTDEEYLFGALYDHGTPVLTFQHKQVRGETYTGGGGSYRESVYIPELERVARRLLDHLEWHGLACIEYIKNPVTGEFTLVEINPRMWRSLAFAVRTGADFPYAYWLAARGQADQIENTYETGVGGHYLYGEFTYLKSIFEKETDDLERPNLGGALYAIAVSCWKQPNFDYLRLEDPAPFVHGIKAFLK